MTAHDLSIKSTAVSGWCAVTDRAYSNDALRAMFVKPRPRIIHTRCLLKILGQQRSIMLNSYVEGTFRLAQMAALVRGTALIASDEVL